MAMLTQTDIQTNPAIAHRGLINVYKPDDPGDKPLPFVLVVHGGGWRNGDHHSIQWLAPAVTGRGWGMVTCTYHLAQEAIFPAAYDDLLHVMAWLREHGPSLGLDPDKAFLLGGSAGGHLVSLLATRVDFNDPQYLHIRAVAAYCPVVDTRAQEAHDPSIDLRITRDFLGGSSQEIPAVFDASSPIKHIHANMPPMFLFHGTGDPTVPYRPTIDFAHAVAAAGVPVTLRIDPAVGHTMIEERSNAEAPAVLRYAEEAWALFEKSMI
jgi:acetyl esterase/lipase